MTQQLTIRIGRNTMAFATQEQTEGEPAVRFEPYVVKSSISMAANLREAFKRSSLLAHEAERVRVMIDSPILLVPVEQFEEPMMEALYNHAFPRGGGQDTVLYNVQPDLHAVAVFSLNRDLKMVIDDHYAQARFVAAVSPVWRHLHQRSFTGHNSKLYGYFHERRLEVFCFQQNRFKFFNSFDASRPNDVLYFLLYVWNQLMLNPETDELHVVGDLFLNDSSLARPQAEWTEGELRKYVQNVYVVNPLADFGENEVTAVKGMPYDMMALLVRGR